MSLFNKGNYILSSGKLSQYKIDCDYLSDDDIECAAFLLSKIVEPFNVVEGIPSGGLRLAEAMRQYETDNSDIVLIVDDVFTTGKSIEKYVYERGGDFYWRAAVIFGRGNPILFPQLRVLCQLPKELW